MYHKQRIGVVIPAFNEEAFVAQTINSIPDYVDLIVAVDDGSHDRTLAEIMGINRPGLIAVRHAVRQGVGSAIRSGFQEILTQNIDIIMTMDADGQMSAHDIPHMLDPLLKGKADLVKGNRFGYKEAKEKMPLMRYLANRGFSKLQSWAHGACLVKDAQSGFTAMTSNLLRQINIDQLWPGYGIYNDLVFQVSHLNARIVNVPIRTIYGQEHSYIKAIDCLKILWLLGSHRTRLFRHETYSVSH